MTSLSAQTSLDQKPGSIPRAQLVWPEEADSAYHIFYSVMDDDGLWSSKLKMSHSNQLNLAPTISTNEFGITWVVWVEVVGNSSQLVYRFFDGDAWAPPRKIITGLSSNTGPALAIDDNNVPWLAWAGFDGSDDEIYYSIWNGNDWNMPERVNQDNSVPDILPRISMSSENKMTIYWDGVESDRYWKFVSTWDGDSWQSKKVIPSDMYENTIKKQAENLPVLPDFVKQPHEASIIYHAKNQFQSFRLRELIIK